MSTQSSSATRRFGIVAIVAIGLGALITGYGVLVLPVAVLGGIHIAAIGLSLLLAGLFTTEWAGNRWGLSTATRNRLSWGFLTLSAVLLVAFVVVNFASFSGPFAESGSETGN